MNSKLADKSHNQRGLRISIRLRMLGAMGLVMGLFLSALLFIVDQRVQSLSGIHNSTEAKNTVIALLPFILIAITLCAILFFYLTNHFLLKPIKQIRNAALAIGNGQLDTTIDSTQNDEVGDLARSVGQMAQALKHDIQNLEGVDQLKSEFIAISSHYLRTPLTGITGGLEILENAALDDNAKHTLWAMRASADRLILFSEDMLMIANFETGHNDVQPEPVHLQDILEPLIEVTRAVAQKKGLTFIAELGDGNIWVYANASMLRLAFRNLLDNACKFTEHGKVTLAVRQQNNQAIIKITDTGIGIPERELPNLFTKFHRGTSMLTYNYEGAGVGLYIAKLILDRHHAEVIVNSKPGSGTEVTVSLPCAPSPASTTKST